MIAAEFTDLTKRFGALTALAGLTLAVRDGELVALLGRNGAGKSTAIAILLGLRVPDGGTVQLYGRDPHDVEVRRRVGVAPQEVAFPPTLRVAEVLTLVGRHYPRPLELDTLAGRFGVERLLRRQLGGLSGGERRLVAVALAFAGRPGLVVLDEPTAGLDGEARRRVWDATRSHVGEGGTVLLTTHRLEEAEALADRVVLLERGVAVDEGTVVEIKRAAGLTRVSFRGDAGPVSQDVEDAGAFVAALVARGASLHELEVRPLTLEEAIARRTAAR